nr:MAG TPA: tail protein [Caudoviricetes sp.]
MPDFSGWTGYQTMDGNTNCRAWADWQTTRVFRNGQAGWDVRIILKANKTTSSPTYGTGNTQVGAHQTNSSVDTKYMTIVQSETTFRDETLFVPAEAGADIPLAAYANIHIPNVVSKGIKFTVTAKRNLWGLYFNANGGSGAPEWMKRHWGEIVYIPSTTPYKSGYTFNGWTKTQGSSTINYKPGDPIGDDADVTLYAVWSQNVTKTWSITYDANGGSNAPAKQTANVGQSITITSSEPTRKGYTFLGWSTWSGATEPEAMFTPGYSYSSDYDITLYAVWKQNQTTQYSLSFSLQGGTGTFNTLYGGYGERVQIPYTTPTKSGYTFKGWATYSGGSVSYQPGEYYTLYGNSTLYAVWQSSGGTTQYYLNFNLQGGSGTFNTLYGVYGERLFIPSSSPTKNGYTFQGWSTSSTGSPQYQPGDYYTIYSNTILYAIWGESTQYCTITFNANGGTGAPSNQQKIIGETTYIPYTKPTRSGYTFQGWSTSSWATSADYQPGSTYTPYGNMTFYAVWKQNVVKTWSIIYNANGGTNAPSTQTANVGQSIIITQDKPIRSSYTFLGWSTWNESPEPEAMFTPGYSYTSDSDTTLYAVWERVNTDPPSLYFPDTYGINLDFNYIPQLSIRANVTNPQDRTIYYKVCYVDNYYGDIHDYYLNSNGNTDTISQTTLNTQIPVTSTIIKKSIQNCNSETEFKLAICVSYENIFDNNAPEMKKYLVTISINNYQKPIIKELYVGRTADGGAQLDTVFKYADSFTKITTGYTGVSVYIDDFIASSSEYTESNSFVGGAKNTINSLLTFINSAVSDYSHVFKIRVDDGIFYTEKTYILGVLRSDGNIYIYSDGRVEANGFVKLNSTDEDAILFKDGGFVYAKNFKKIANGVYLCPDVFEMFGRENTSMAYLLNQN